MSTKNNNSTIDNYVKEENYLIEKTQQIFGQNEYVFVKVSLIKEFIDRLQDKENYYVPDLTSLSKVYFNNFSNYPIYKFNYISNKINCNKVNKISNSNVYAIDKFAFYNELLKSEILFVRSKKDGDDYILDESVLCFNDYNLYKLKLINKEKEKYEREHVYISKDRFIKNSNISKIEDCYFELKLKYYKLIEEIEYVIKNNIKFYDIIDIQNKVSEVVNKDDELNLDFINNLSILLSSSSEEDFKLGLEILSNISIKEYPFICFYFYCYYYDEIKEYDNVNIKFFKQKMSSFFSSSSNLHYYSRDNILRILNCFKYEKKTLNKTDKEFISYKINEYFKKEYKILFNNNLTVN